MEKLRLNKVDRSARPIEFLSHRRDLEPRDFLGCVSLADKKGEFEEGSKESIRLFEFWQKLLSQHLGQGAIIDLHTPHGIQIAGFGITCWITNRFVDWVQSKEIAEDDHSLLYRLMEPENLQRYVVLDRKKIARGVFRKNLNLFVAQFDIDLPRLGKDLQREISAADLDAIKDLHSGYGIRSFSEEVFYDAFRKELEETFYYTSIEWKRADSWFLIKRLEDFERIKSDFAFFDVRFPTDSLFFPPPRELVFGLNQDEKDLFYCIANSLTRPEIAEVLGEKPSTVDRRMKRLKKDLHGLCEKFPEVSVLFPDKERDHEFDTRLARLLRTHDTQLRPSPCLKAHLWRNAKYPGN